MSFLSWQCVKMNANYKKLWFLSVDIQIWIPFLRTDMKRKKKLLNMALLYSLISMRTIYYFVFDTWAIIWHSTACWFMVCAPPPFSQFLFVVIIKLFCTDMKIKTKTIQWSWCGNPGKSWEIFRNQLTISCQIVTNISKL